MIISGLWLTGVPVLVWMRWVDKLRSADVICDIYAIRRLLIPAGEINLG